MTAKTLQDLDRYTYILGGREGNFPLDLGDADGSVWTYDAETHTVEKVE